ncbi:calcium/sodium antiporter [Pontibaca methylaminivorans]|uniref:Cation:H+ antiporter n=1 Tax=Pontibaca methylaminivorans TaxID=515897 RepID=A0A1R3WWR1_9RHOB|nr:calcium/sodium antiporter [Pontibaca methylaminivorans]SIT82888.1 cation:H+ antiporter [Pontibaca methylaminivorans]
MTDILILLGGFAALIFGGELLVRGAVALAQRFNVPPLIIGLTLVGFGTSLPELVTSIEAALAGSPGIAVGNVVGSNIVNILLILGLAALISPLAVPRAGFLRDGVTLSLATVLCLVVVLVGVLERWSGGVLLAVLATYLGIMLWRELHRPAGAGEGLTDDLPSPVQGGWVNAALALVAGLVLTILGAKYMVAAAISIAAAAGMSETLIGLTIVALGTSMPELVTSVIAARKGHSAVALGNIIGSNIFNMLGILGVTALVKPLRVPDEIISLDIWVMIAATAALLLFARTGWRIERREGAALMAGYAAYIGWLLRAVI